MPSEDRRTLQRPVTAFGTPRPMLPDQPVFLPEAAAVGPIELDGSAFLFLVSTSENYMFRVSRDHLLKIQAAIAETLRETSEGGH